MSVTNKKSHTGFRLVPTSMTLNDVERRNRPYFAFLRNSIDFQADYKQHARHAVTITRSAFDCL